MKYDLTVFIPTYNHEKFIRRAINSVLNQKFNGRAKIIIRDDKSTDKTVKILNHYKKFKNISIIFSKKRMYHMVGRKKGFALFYEALKKINTKYFAILDGDDFWSDKLKIHRQINAFKKDKKVKLVLTNYRYKKIGNRFDIRERQNNLLHNSTSLYKTNFLKKILKKYKKKLFFNPVDLMMFILIDEYGKKIVMDKVTTTITLHNTNYTKKYENNEYNVVKLINYLSKFEKFENTKINILYLKFNALKNIIKKFSSYKDIKIFLYLYDFLLTIFKIKLLK